MNLATLRTRTQRYVRDIAGKKFSTAELDDYINEGVDRLRSYIVFKNMPYANLADQVAYLPPAYHYMLALYGASRCFGVSGDFYQEDQRRNEFENMFADLIMQIENGDLIILDELGQQITDATNAIYYVQDTYFGGSSTTEETTI